MAEPRSVTDRSLAERLADALVAAGCTAMFGMPGGGPNLDVLGAAVARGIRFVLAHAETEAAIMAGTYGLLTGAPTPVVVTRGPGAAAVANGAAQATLDRFPLVVVADTVPRSAQARVAHQRIDQRALLAPITKLSATLADHTTDADLARWLATAAHWPFGAVHLDYDPSAGEAAPPEQAAPAAPGPRAGETAPSLASAGLASGDPAVPGRSDGPDDQELGRRLGGVLAGAERPVVIVGVEAAATPGIGPLVAALGCPVLATYQAVGLVPTEGPLGAGVFTNGALERPVLEAADLIVTVGLDLVEPIPNRWPYPQPLVRLSAVPQTDTYLPPATVDLVGDLAAHLRLLVDAAAHRTWTWPDGAAAAFRAEARRRLRTVEPERAEPLAGAERFGPVQLVDTVAAHRPERLTVTVDAGAHFLAVLPLWPVDGPHRLLISNGLATMGFALPAAIGAALARPGEPVLALTGDGGLAMALAELETVARLDLPVTVVVFNDSALSLIEIKQRPGHGGASAVRYHPVDFAAVAAGCGLAATVVTSAGELAAAVADPAGWHRPRLLDARIDPADYPHLINVTRG